MRIGGRLHQGGKWTEQDSLEIEKFPDSLDARILVPGLKFMQTTTQNCCFWLLWHLNSMARLLELALRGKEADGPKLIRSMGLMTPSGHCMSYLTLMSGLVDDVGVISLAVQEGYDPLGECDRIYFTRSTCLALEKELVHFQVDVEGSRASTLALILNQVRASAALGQAGDWQKSLAVLMEAKGAAKAARLPEE